MTYTLVHLGLCATNVRQVWHKGSWTGALLSPIETLNLVDSILYVVTLSSCLLIRTVMANNIKVEWLVTIILQYIKDLSNVRHEMKHVYVLLNYY